jgi:hypothetical protein
MCLQGHIYSLTGTSRLNPLWIGALVLVIRIGFLSNLGTIQVVKYQLPQTRHTTTKLSQHQVSAGIFAFSA